MKTPKDFHIKKLGFKGLLRPVKKIGNITAPNIPLVLHVRKCI